MDAERRQVTILFTDMVGFTTFSERSGEEAAYTLMRNLSKLMADAVREQGGVVQGFTGDGIMAVFGAPVAFEDAPLRACRAALSIRNVSRKPDLNSKPNTVCDHKCGLAFSRRPKDALRAADAGLAIDFKFRASAGNTKYR